MNYKSIGVLVIAIIIGALFGGLCGHYFGMAGILITAPITFMFGMLAGRIATHI